MRVTGYSYEFELSSYFFIRIESGFDVISKVSIKFSLFFSNFAIKKNYFCITIELRICLMLLMKSEMKLRSNEWTEMK